jgi:hypothetical protein
MKITLTIEQRDLEALVALLPKCRCGTVAEVELNGRPACMTCALQVRRARCRTLPHADAAVAIQDALSPFIPSGRWERDG